MSNLGVVMRFLFVDDFRFGLVIYLNLILFFSLVVWFLLILIL